MFQGHRSLTDFLLIRARIEPGPVGRLRVFVRRRGMGPGEVGVEQVFTDAEEATSFVRAWLHGVIRRWEGGERSWPFRPADGLSAERPGPGCDGHEV